MLGGSAPSTPLTPILPVASSRTGARTAATAVALARTVGWYLLFVFNYFYNLLKI